MLMHSSAARRRTYAAEVVDWTRAHTKSDLSFIAAISIRGRHTNRNNFSLTTQNDSESYAYLLKYFRDLGLDAGETSINDRRIDYVLVGAYVSLRRAEVLRTAAIGAWIIGAVGGSGYRNNNSPGGTKCL